MRSSSRVTVRESVARAAFLVGESFKTLPHVCDSLGLVSRPDSTPFLSVHQLPSAVGRDLAVDLDRLQERLRGPPRARRRGSPWPRARQSCSMQPTHHRALSPRRADRLAARRAPSPGSCASAGSAAAPPNCSARSGRRTSSSWTWSSAGTSCVATTAAVDDQLDAARAALAAGLVGVPRAVQRHRVADAGAGLARHVAAVGDRQRRLGGEGDLRLHRDRRRASPAPPCRPADLPSTVNSRAWA